MLAEQGKLTSSGANDRHSGYERERTGPPVSPAKRNELANPVDEVNFLHGPEGEDASLQSPVPRRLEFKVQSERQGIAAQQRGTAGAGTGMKDGLPGCSRTARHHGGG